LHFLQLRKDYLIKKTKTDLLILASKYVFVKNVTDDNIKVNKVKKVDIIKQIENYDKIITVDDSYDYLFNMKIYNLTEEKLEELLQKIRDKKVELTEIENKSIQDTWKDEIKEC